MHFNKTYLNNKNITPGKNSMEYLVLHHTGAVGSGNINILAGLTNAKLSVHYLVRPDGTIYHFVDENKIAWHCGVSEYEGRTDLNRYSIGIEVESDAKSYTNAQKRETVNLIKDIIKRHPKIKVIRHKDISKRKRDVSDKFWLDEYKSFESFVASLYTDNTEEKKALIQDIMQTNSDLRNKYHDLLKLGVNQTTVDRLEEGKDVLNRMNIYFRSVGF